MCGSTTSHLQTRAVCGSDRIGAEFPDDVLGFLLEKLADVEYRLAHATNEQLQLSAGGRVPVRAWEARGCRSLTERSCAETHCVHDIV